MPTKKDEDDVFGVKEFTLLVEKGKAAYKQGRLLDAIQAWKSAQAADPSRRGELAGYLDKAVTKQAALHLQNARRFAGMGEKEKAAAQYKQILRLGPKDEAVREEAAEQVRDSEASAAAMSLTVLGSIAGGFLLLALLILWFILSLD